MSNLSEPTLLITTLAVYQTEFWSAVAGQLRAQGRRCVFLSFDDRSTELLRRAGFETFSPDPQSRCADIDDERLAAFLAEFHIQGLNYWLAHERVTFGIGDSAALRAKLVAYTRFADEVCRSVLARGERAVMVQEVGGFLSVIGSYFAARRHGIDNWFIEPSFFRGRLFFTRNTFAAPDPSLAVAREPIGEVQSYLEDTLQKRQLVVPLKDRHHYSAAASKILNRRNATRLVQKLVDKHLLGKHQEFGHIGQHVSTHLRMLRNSLRLRPHYQPLESLGPFVYYPFHVPADMALTIRSPQYLDQLALVDLLARTIPHTHRLAVKEHPAMIGTVDARRLIALLRRYDNLVLLPPTSNNYDVLGRAELVVSVNSKSGAEALLTGAPVIVLGDAFYRLSGLVRAVERTEELAAAVAGQVTASRPVPARADVARFFQRVWDASLPGELFIATPENAATFARSLLTAVGDAP